MRRVGKGRRVNRVRIVRKGRRVKRVRRVRGVRRARRVRRVKRVRKVKSGMRACMTDLLFLPLAVLHYILHIAVCDVDHFYL